MEIIIGLIAIVIVCFLALSFARSEAKVWNKGVCRTNGLPWKLQDKDSQGGRLYRAGEETIWISWPVDR